MLNYSYRAWNISGQPVTGVIAGDSQAQAVEQLRSRGLVVGRLELSKDVDLQRSLRRYRESRPVSLSDLALFARQFATMIAAGVPILQSLGVVAGQAKGRPLGAALTAVAGDIRAGASLTEAFSRRGERFPELLVHMVAVGEAGGVLEEVLLRLADLYERESTINQKTRSALIYPVVVLGAAVLVAGFLVTVVLPQYATLFASQGATLPWPTRFLLGLSRVLRQGWPVLLALALLAGFGLRRLGRQPRWAERFDVWKLQLPIWGPLTVNRGMSLFSRTLGTLLRTGVPVLPSLSVAGRGLGNSALLGPLARAQQAVRDGRSMLGPLRESPFYPSMLLEMMAVGEEAGSLDLMLFKAADYYDREVSTTVDRLTALIEPVLVLLLGAVVGFIVLSMVLPMFDSWQLIG
ncbi:MAG: type II secretion system F family protein [Symbiobacteriia bacterium]